jgi:hypothetical protein
MAQVGGERILLENQPVSPNEFANIPGCARRNAWTTIWLMFPGEHEWKRADDCRPQPRRRAT